MKTILNIAYLLALVTLLTCTFDMHAQQTYDLQKLLKENKLDMSLQTAVPITDGKRKGISMDGFAWIAGEDFTNGTIELDMKGHEGFQSSFLGVAFHSVDTITFDVVYFRPFNFRAEDPIRKIHAVQYMAGPDFHWDRLRAERNGMYEKAVTPAPKATDWFHATIEISGEDIIVFIDHSTTPSLVVKKLNTRTSGKIGLWNQGLKGSFANLSITRRN